jgi:hypothetical protein
MNDRLVELKLQAMKYVDSVVPENRRYNDIYYDTLYGKLIETVIKECAVVANRADNDDREIRSIYEVVLTHFGVEQ